MVVELTGAHVNITHAPLRAGDVKHSLADTTRIKEVGFTSQTTLEEGLRATVEALRSRMK
jgi:nucleoside-diphosphate-sugar epimerase